jgi:hypothetical protein
MLNPSRADEVHNDPTIARAVRRARLLGYGGLLATNLFSACATDPRALTRLPDPVGPENDEAILQAAAAAHRVICAWGVHGRLGERGVAVEALLRRAGHPLWVLRLNGDGSPAHPLYLSYALDPRPWPSSRP